MKKTMIPILGLAATVALSFLCSTAFAQEKQTAQCTLTYKIKNMLSVNAEGPCKIFQTEDILNIQGIVNENGQTYIANIDIKNNVGLLIGAGTFTLAHGKLTKNEPTEVIWPNGYILKIKMK